MNAGYGHPPPGWAGERESVAREAAATGSRTAAAREAMRDVLARSAAIRAQARALRERTAALRERLRRPRLRLLR
jgi:hypothetical protein